MLIFVVVISTGWYNEYNAWTSYKTLFL
uniref:Putative C-1-tetrahydrofolate synthase n=1 Tax=Arabidopsis thaliana TaxID=3702 RepID=Q9ZUQ2_ARATH|nr:putative C-1-tetrahydrofolate synthase [Arabidopsis thaliana]